MSKSPEDFELSSSAQAKTLLSTEDMAEMLGRTPGAIRTAHHRGQLPPSLVIGRRRYWRRSTVDRWLRELEAKQKEGPE